MKKLKIFAIALLLANSFWSCEKDDICPEGTPTTPNVVIEFYDAANPENLKNVTNLRVVSPGFSEDTEANKHNGVSKIKVPLKTNEDQTILQFIQNGGDDDAANDNTDVLTFNYGRTDIYVSRACGYKTIFQLNDSNPVLTDNDTPDGLWISSINVQQSNIQYENETHIKIYF